MSHPQLTENESSNRMLIFQCPLCVAGTMKDHGTPALPCTSFSLCFVHTQDLPTYHTPPSVPMWAPNLGSAYQPVLDRATSWLVTRETAGGYAGWEAGPASSKGVNLSEAALLFIPKGLWCLGITGLCLQTCHIYQHHQQQLVSSLSTEFDRYSLSPVCGVNMQKDGDYCFTLLHLIGVGN